MTKETFIAKFCEVGFLCHDGAPNWLGMLLLGVVVFGIVATALMMLHARPRV